MDRDQFLKKLTKLRQWKKFGKRAPHKPLLLLLAVSRLINHNQTRLEFSDVQGKLKEMLEEFGPPRKTHHPGEPFKRLQNDQIWVLVNSAGYRVPTPVDKITIGLLKSGVSAGFSDEVLKLFREHPDLGAKTVSILLEENFPESYHDSILSSVGLDQSFAQNRIRVERKVRDPNFREKILNAYRRSCAICESSFRVANALIILEAAHIKWHAAGGPDCESNGLALCVFHHRAFDRGVLGLKPKHGNFSVQVSPLLNGHGPMYDEMLSLENKAVRTPVYDEHRPDIEFVKWHSHEVFKH